MLYEIYKLVFRKFIGVSPFFSGFLILILYAAQWAGLAFMANLFFPATEDHTETIVAWEAVAVLGTIVWVIYCVYMVFGGLTKYEILYTVEVQKKGFVKRK